MRKKSPSLTPFLKKTVLVCLGVLFLFVVTEIMMRAGSCLMPSSQEYKNALPGKQKNTYRILCVGEAAVSSSMPYFLEKKLNQKNSSVKFIVIDKTLTGLIPANAAERLEKDIAHYRPDMVVTTMGMYDYKLLLPDKAGLDAKGKSYFKSSKIYSLARSLWINVVGGIQRSRPDYVKLGYEFMRRENYRQAKLLFERALRINSLNDSAYLGLGDISYKEGEVLLAKELYEKAMGINPDNSEAYYNLGLVYYQRGNYIPAEELFKKTISLNYENSKAYRKLGLIYRSRGNLIEAEEFLKKAIKFSPEDCEAYNELAWVYQSQRKFLEAEAVLFKNIGLDPMNDTLYSRLALLYQEMGLKELEREYYEKAKVIRRQSYNIVITDALLSFYDILIRNETKLVCAQYPMYRIEPLRKVFEDKRGVVFVNNEKIFQEAVSGEGYRDFFIEDDKTEFSYCTSKGNNLLAENIANVIINEYFNKCRNFERPKQI